MTYEDIINKINDKIENSKFEKFDLDQVIMELNNTYRDLANKTDIFETFDYIKLADDQLNYELPFSIYRPSRAVYRGKRIDFKAQEEMDLVHPTWEMESAPSQLQAFIYNNISDRKVKAYPRLTDMTVTASDSEILFLGTLEESVDTTNVYLYMNKNTGAKYVSAVFQTATAADLIEVATVYGTYLPPEITVDDLHSSRIFIDEIHVNALIYGTAGQLLFTLGRTEDMAKAQNYMRLYGVDDTEIGAIRKKDFDSGFKNTGRNNYYRTPFKN